MGWILKIVFLDMVCSRCYTMNQHGQVSTHGDRWEQAEGIWNPSLGHFLFTMLATKRYIILSPLLKFLFFSCSVVFNFLWPYGLQHARLPCPSLSPRVCSDSCPLCLWCHPTISSSVTAFSSCFTFIPFFQAKYFLICHHCYIFFVKLYLIIMNKFL